MSRHDNKIIRDAVKWISKIRPEYQVEELTRETQKAFIRQARDIRGICFGCMVGFTGTLMMTYAIDKRVSKLEEKQMKMQMDIDFIKMKTKNNDEN